MRKGLCIGLAVAVLLSGCAGYPKRETEDPEKDTVASDLEYLITKHEWQGMYFYDVVSRDAEGKRPLIFFLHGLGGEKEDVVSYAKRLADQGYTVAVPDCVGHGESRTEQPLNFFDVMQQTAAGCIRILEYYQNSEYGDPSRFSMVGISMGGMIALYSAAYSERQPEAVVSVCGTADWESILGDDEIYINFVDGGMQPMGEESEKDALIVSLVQNSPDQNLAYLLQTPILMINGDADETIPISGVKSFIAKAGLYPNQLEWIIEEERGHEVGAGDVDETIDFFAKYMPATEPVSGEENQNGTGETESEAGE